MRFAEFSGSPYEIGLQRGKTYKNLLRDGYKRFCAYPANRQMVETVELMGESLEQSFPEAIDEIRGTAEGAGMSFKEVLRVCFAEELYLACDCSHIAFTESSVGPIYAKAEDAGLERSYFVARTTREGRLRFVAVACPNWVVGAVSGINEAGLCIGESSAGNTDETITSGISRLMLMRFALDRCSNVDEAIDLYAQTKIARRGVNHIMIDGSGNMAVVEKSPTKQAVRTTDGNFLCATNHYLAEEMRCVAHSVTGTELDFDRRLAYEANTKQRYSRLFNYGKICVTANLGIDDMKALLRTHGIGGLCQHGLMQTTFAMIGLPQQRKLLITDGPPCRSEFIAYEI